MKPFDLTPHPNVLLALTHTPLKPLDALSEIIDNAVDSFKLARNSGQEISDPIVIVSLPRATDLNVKKGVLRVRDNGPGMSPEMAEMALKAGFSGNNPYDSLGLFGMGLNIATGKLGRVTTLITARKKDDLAIKVVVDLVAIRENEKFEVIPEEVEKPNGFSHGTIIEVGEWWPEGNANYGFIQKLISYGRPKTRQEVGRRYSTILRGKQIRIIVDEEICEHFEHCVWNDTRFVERRGHGKIFAVKRFDEAIGSQTRCTNCYALVSHGISSCQVCASAAFRTIEEKIRGWVGIQRYDDASHFGIDLIRNGRVIRKLEKAAFFEFTDDFGVTIKDYPADSPYGRIVGEVHLDHVPVDFMKQDFQRSSSEWQRAISYLRGDSSLQPNQPAADKNNSPVYFLFQGYRRVRRCGTTDMYMGYWDEQENAPKRIDRKTEKEFLANFKERKPGFYDDSEWWKLVEKADSPPVEKLIVCTYCEAENLESAEICQVCEAILRGKPCIECKEEIALSALRCMHCGKSQVPIVEEPWTCKVCGQNNHANVDPCINCKKPRGTPNPFSIEYLEKNSDRDDELCIQGCSVKLADGTQSPSIDVFTYITRKPLVGGFKDEHLPAIIHKRDSIRIFLDKNHPMFLLLGIKPQQLVAGEVAYYLHVTNGRLAGSVHSAAHSLGALEWAVLEKYWAESLSDSPEQVRNDVENIFKEIRQKLSECLGEKGSDFFDEFQDRDKRSLVTNLIDSGEDISDLGRLKSDGRYLNYVSPTTIVDIFRRHTSLFFDGAVWAQPYAKIPEIPENIMEDVRQETKSTYLNCLEDCSEFLLSGKPDPVIVRRTRSSIDYLLKKLVLQ